MALFVDSPGGVVCDGRVTSFVVIGRVVASVLVEAEETMCGLLWVMGISEVGVMADVENVGIGEAEEG